MAIDGVPLWVGGGEAEHSADLLRMLSYAVFRGQEGFLYRPQVLPLGTPGAGIQLLPTVFNVNSKFAGGALQSYMGRVYTAETVATTATPVGSTRSDLVVLNIEDPYPSGGVQWAYPGASGSEGRRLGPYVRLKIIPNVPVNTFSVSGLPSDRTERNWSAIAVARLDRPANSNTVTIDQIKPLGVVINPFQGVTLPPEILNNLASITDAIDDLGDAVEGLIKQRFPVPGIFVDTQYSVNGGASGVILPTDNTYKQFPQEAQWQVLIPTWATYAEVLCVMTGAYQRATAVSTAAHIWGALRVVIGASNGDDCPFDYDEIPGGNLADVNRLGNRPVFVTATTIPIASADRGKKVTVKQQGRMFADANTKGKVVADAGTNTYINITFKESA
jgi:hypothetical protein